MRWVKYQVKDDLKEFKGQLNVVFTAEPQRTQRQNIFSTLRPRRLERSGR